MAAANAVEKSNIGDITLECKELGGHRVRATLSKHDKELLEKLFKAVKQTRYTSQVELTKKGELIYRLNIDIKELTYDQLKQKVYNLIKRKLEQQQQKSDLGGSSGIRQPKKRRKGRNRSRR